MLFSKKNRLAEFPIEYQIGVYGDQVFRVYVKPRMTEDADEARRALFAVPDAKDDSPEAKAEQEAAVTKAAANVLATIVVRAPTEEDGFAEFPTEGELAANVAEYFNDIDLYQHMEQILSMYWAAIFPRPYLKSTSHNRAPSDSASGA
jgi:hypothetical protein